MFKTETLFKAAAVGCVLMFSSIASFAQTAEPVSTPASLDSKSPATIGEITELSRQLKVEQLKRELREARGEEPKEVEKAEANKPEPVVAPLPPVKIIPPTPAVSAIYGRAGQPLRVRLAGGLELGLGESHGEWKMTEVNASGVTFERCEQLKRGRKTETECMTRFVTPRG